MKFKTVQETISKLREANTPLETPRKPKRKKRRKTDIRTIRRKEREYRRSWRAEKGDLEREWAGTLKWQYYMLRRAMKRKLKTGESKATWELSLNEWLLMWCSVPAIEVFPGKFVPAYRLRGRKKDDVQLSRIDKNKSWNIDNLMIVKGKEVLYKP